MEIEAITNICEVFFKEEEAAKLKIEKLEQERDAYSQELFKLKADMQSKSLQEQDRFSREITYLRKRFQQLKYFAEIEVKVNSAIA